MLNLSLDINVFLLLLKVFRCSLRRDEYSAQIQAVNECFQLYLSEYQLLKDNKQGCCALKYAIYIWEKYAGNI